MAATNEDTTAKLQRQMLDGKRGSKIVSDFFEIEDIISATYNADNTVATMVIQKISADGTTWQKSITYSYTGGNLTGKTETLTAVA